VWGEVDARLGRLVSDDPLHQATAPKAPLGVQGILYLALLGLPLSGLLGWFLPSHPTLAQVMVFRAVYAGLLVFLLTAAGYGRGALNAEQR